MGDLLPRKRRKRVGGKMVKRGNSRAGCGKVAAGDLHINASGQVVGGVVCSILLGRSERLCGAEATSIKWGRECKQFMFSKKSYVWQANMQSEDNVLLKHKLSLRDSVPQKQTKTIKQKYFCGRMVTAPEYTAQALATCTSTRSTYFHKFLVLQTAKASLGDLLPRKRRDRMGGEVVKRGNSRAGCGKVAARDLHIDASGQVVGGLCLK